MNEISLSPFTSPLLKPYPFRFLIIHYSQLINVRSCMLHSHHMLHCISNTFQNDSYILGISPRLIRHGTNQVSRIPTGRNNRSSLYPLRWILVISDTAHLADPRYVVSVTEQIKYLGYRPGGTTTVPCIRNVRFLSYRIPITSRIPATWYPTRNKSRISDTDRAEQPQNPVSVTLDSCHTRYRSPRGFPLRGIRHGTIDASRMHFSPFRTKSLSLIFLLQNPCQSYLSRIFSFSRRREPG